MRLGLSEARFRRLLFVEQREAFEDRLRDVARQRVPCRDRVEQLRETIGGGAVIAAQGDIGQPRGDGDADQRAGRMHIGFRGAHVGPLPHEFRGQAERQIGRQGQRLEIECLRHLGGRILPGQGGEQIALLRERLLERRQQLHHLRQRRLLHEHIGDRHGAQRILLAQYIQKLLSRLDHFARRGDLAAQGGFLNCGGGDIGRQREIGCLELVTLLVGLRFERLTLRRFAPQMSGVYDTCNCLRNRA